MPNLDTLWPVLIPLLVLAVFGWRYFKSGSIVGALLGGRIKSTVGEISLASRGGMARILRVQTLEPGDGGPLEVALAITSKAAFGASVVPFRLTKDQARQLAGLLQRAGQG